ncbi:phosphotransferase enzyme family protein [Kribbella caucasensis]|uniref:phosphotransferase enzyme family protein n=1 Tax=Kribbella caucasensis TaxID=2512215 RepID=UPI001EDFED87|nr:aminoglycoside phosphotransferase family protein [Kribbella sp. VKM Ac-2527]
MDDKLREWILADYGIGVVELTPIHEGADVAAEVWRASTTAVDQHAGGATTGDQYAVKWSGGGTDAGTRATAHLSARGVRGIPEPIRTLTGEPHTHRGGRRLSLTRWVEGARAAETGLTTEQWSQYGALLARVHSTEPSAALIETLPSLNPINARMPALVDQLTHRLTTQAPQDAVEAELAKVWHENDETIKGLLKLAAELERPNGIPVICHADPHLGNVLRTEDQLYLIDWDDVVLAPREQDLMFMLGGMGTLGPTTPEQLDAFFTGYGLTGSSILTGHDTRSLPAG